MRRTQLYLEGAQDTLLEARARQAGTTKSALVREAIDAFLAGSDAAADGALTRMRAAVRDAAGAAPDLPDGARYVEALRAADSARAERIAAQRSR